MKKLIISILAMAFLFSSCSSKGSSSSEETSQVVVSSSVASSSSTSESEFLGIVFSNASDMTLNEIHITPSAIDKDGNELLGDTRVLKSNGTVEFQVQAYEYENYDVKLVSDTKEEYKFIKVPIFNNDKLSFYFDSTGATIDVVNENGQIVATIVNNKNNSSSSSQVPSSSNSPTPASTPAPTPTPTPTPAPVPTPPKPGERTNGEFSFLVNNSSGFDIYEIYIGIANGDPGKDLDLLETILFDDEQTLLRGKATKGDWGETEWSMYVVDSNGVTSSFYELFNPWELIAVDIYWDANVVGYVCDFLY